MAYFPVFVLQESLAVATSSKSEASGDGDETSEAVIAVVDEKEIDVRKLMAQVETLEKDLTVAESSLNVMKNSLSTFLQCTNVYASSFRYTYYK